MSLEGAALVLLPAGVWWSGGGGIYGGDGGDGGHEAAPLSCLVLHVVHVSSCVLVAGVISGSSDCETDVQLHA